MAWLNRDVYIKTLMLVFASLIIGSSSRDAEEGEPEIHLSHVCAHPDQCEAEPAVPIIMLHGLADTKETWDGIYQDISSITRRMVCVYDARNHGDSGWNDTHTVDVLAEDLQHFMNTKHIERAVLVGHSMGGRTVMKFALNHPSRVERFIVEDVGLVSIPEKVVAGMLLRMKVLLSSLDVIPGDVDEATAKKTVLDFLRQVSIEAIPEHLEKHLPLNLRDGVWKWKSNFDAIKKVLLNPGKFFPKLEGGLYEGKALFIYGTASWYRVGDQKENVRKLFPNAEFFGVDGAGHFIHFKYPEYLREIFRFLK